MAELIRKKRVISWVVRKRIQVETMGSYKVIVDYRLSLEAMVKAGKYDSVYDKITLANFPFDARSPEEVEIHLVQISGIITDDVVIEELDKMGFRPATLPELLAFGAANLELRLKFPLLALGSRWPRPHGYDFFPRLRLACGKRSLSLDWRDRIRWWLSGCRFAAIRK